MRNALSLVIAFLVAACSGTPKTGGTVKINHPEAFREASRGQNAQITSGWVRQFNDRKMAALVQEALANNPSLQATAARLEATRESLITSRARRLPRLSASSTTSSSASADSSDVSTSFGLSFSASWEADVWGRLRDLDRATYYDYSDAVARLRGARFSIAANTAQAYYNLITAQLRVDLAKTTLASFQRNLRIIERSASEGLSRDLDVAFGRNNVSSAERSLVASELSRDNAARALETLLGRYPAAEIKAARSLPTLTRNPPAGLPTTLLERRPDLASARAAVLASAARSDASQKSLLPDLRLTGSAGNTSSSFADILRPEFLLYSAAASLGQTIYQGGALRAEARAALDRHRAELSDYAGTALEAFREVEAALAIDRSLAKQAKFLRDEAEKAALAEKFAERGYTEGLTEILSLLEAQRRNNNARAALITLANQRIQNRIDLHLALGGSY